MNGILILRGPDIRSGMIVTEARMTDLAPTILYAMGLPVPLGMDGKVLTKAFAPAHLESNPIVYGEEPIEKRKTKYTFSVSDEDKIKKRLKALGYLS